MFPVPFDSYVPSFYTRDEKLEAFTDKMDEIMNGISDDILGLNNLIDPVRIPEPLTVELGYLLGAGIKPLDSLAQKRKKIASAIKRQKLRTTFAYDAKIIIDAIVGGDAEVYRAVELDDEIVTGDGNTPSAYNWSTVGVDGVYDELGIIVSGAGSEVVIPGNIYIDVDSSTLTPAEVQQIVDELEYDVAPAYMILYLGYVTAGVFTVYANGIIG